MATPVSVPPLGESVTQAILVKWHKADGQSVQMDEPLCELETDKANVDIPSPITGTLRQLKKQGETVAVGDNVATIDPTSASATLSPQSSSPNAAAPPPSSTAPRVAVGPEAHLPPPAAATADLSPAVRRLVEENKLDPKSIPASGIGGRLTKEDVTNYLNTNTAAAPAAPAPKPAPKTSAPAAEPARDTLPAPLPVTATGFDAKGIRREPMTKIRKRIAQTLVAAQQTAAILTTFNEIDLTEVIELRTRYKDRFQEVYGVGLGFMSFFARAVVLALREFPKVNAFIEGDDIVYHQFVNLGIAVSTDRGLAVPVLRNIEQMSFATIEAQIKRLAAATRDGKLGLNELTGATFTITNGGVFGSLLSTPILTPPQSGILGLHAIQKRPVVINDKIEVRSMMYVALSYDHRLVDGRESVSFLVRLKQLLEDPSRLMLEI